MTNDTLITIMAIVTAYVSYIKAFNLFPSKYLPLIALVLAVAFLMVPANVFSIVTLGSMIGLGATGFYHATQNKPTDPIPTATNKPKE